MEKKVVGSYGERRYACPAMCFHIQTSVKSGSFVPRFEVVKHNYKTMNMIAQEITLGEGVA